MIKYDHLAVINITSNESNLYWSLRYSGIIELILANSFFSLNALTNIYIIKQAAKITQTASMNIIIYIINNINKFKKYITNMYGVHIHKYNSKKENKEKIINGNLEKSLLHATKKWTCAQIFTHGPRTMNINEFDEKMIKHVATMIPIYSHASYLTHPWKSDKSHKHLKDQLNLCKKMGLKGLVVHLPKDKPDVVVQAMKIINDKDIPLILEMTSVSPNANTYETPEKLNYLINELDRIGNINYGICIDTSHVWAAGQDMKYYNDVKKWLNKITSNRITLFHLNGTTIPLGGHKDVHSVPFSSDDLIWGDVKYNDSGFKAIQEFAYIHNIPIIMEVKGNTDKVHSYLSNVDLLN